MYVCVYVRVHACVRPHLPCVRKQVRSSARTLFFQASRLVAKEICVRQKTYVPTARAYSMGLQHA